MSKVKLLRPQNLDRLYSLKRVLVMRIPEEKYFQIMQEHRPQEVTGVLELDRLAPGELLVCSLVTGPCCLMQVQHDKGEKGGYPVHVSGLSAELEELLKSSVSLGKGNPVPTPKAGGERTTRGKTGPAPLPWWKGCLNSFLYRDNGHA